MNGSLNPVLYEISIWAIPAIIAITFHEASHGYVAAWRLGRVSCNPLAHIDPFGTVLLPGILLADASRGAILHLFASAARPFIDDDAISCCASQQLPRRGLVCSSASGESHEQDEPESVSRLAANESRLHYVARRRQFADGTAESGRQDFAGHRPVPRQRARKFLAAILESRVLAEKATSTRLPLAIPA